MKRISDLSIHLLKAAFFMMGCFLFVPVQAQWIFSDENYSYQRIPDRPFPNFQRNTPPDTLSISPSQPFFDDFAYRSGEPDTNRWYTPSLFFDVPAISFHMAVSPPTQGVVTFDGISRAGEPYATNGLITGVGDRLFSQCIDLSGYSTSDQIVLSFALQPQGRGDAPESSDAFEVSLRTSNQAPNDYIKVLTVNGTSLRNFQTYSILLDDPAYFHSCFQIAFQSRGSLSVPADHWQLDYVYMAPNRKLGDTTFLDAAPVDLTVPPTRRYSAMPLQHFNLANNQQAFSVEVANRFNESRSIPFNLNVNDPVGFNPWTGPSSEMGNSSVGAFSNSSISFNSFQSQSFAQTGGISLEFITELPSDINRENDTLRQLFAVDSLWAYDDGEADGIFGLNRQLGYGVRLDLDTPDSISAVWIHFEPLVHVNSINGTVTYMKDETFRLVVWNAADPDSILASKIHRVEYGPDRRSFIRYEFSSPVVVDSTCWVGVQQMSKLPLGVGVDHNYQRDAYMYFDSLGTWTNINLEGSLMIRPESFHGGRFTSDVQEELAAPAINLFPNPAYQPYIELEGKPGSLIKKMLLRNLLGQEVFTIESPREGLIALPKQLKAGYYVWEIQWESGERKQVKWEYRGQ